MLTVYIFFVRIGLSQDWRGWKAAGVDRYRFARNTWGWYHSHRGGVCFPLHRPIRHPLISPQPQFLCLSSLNSPEASSSPPHSFFTTTLFKSTSFFNPRATQSYSHNYQHQKDTWFDFTVHQVWYIYKQRSSDVDKAIENSQSSCFLRKIINR